jgi:hypothetical protein
LTHLAWQILYNTIRFTLITKLPHDSQLADGLISGQCRAFEGNRYEIQRSPPPQAWLFAVALVLSVAP